MFDAESNLNPASLYAATSVTAGFVFTPEWRRWQTEAGSATVKQTRFPLVHVTGPIPRSPWTLSVSLGNYADRDHQLATVDTIDIRGQPVGVFDTVTSLGGLNDLRFAASYIRGRSVFGAGFHVITGSTRLDARRSFSDSTFLPSAQRAELSYGGIGLSLGVIHQVSRRLTVAALVRSDRRAEVDLDSAPAYHVDLPYTFGGGLLYQASPKLALAGQAVFRTWSGANSDIQREGGIGARNSIELSLGGEFLANPRRPYRRPIRFGLRYAELPFPLTRGETAREFAIAAGSGVRFASDRAGLDVTLEHAWRGQRGGFRERAFQITVGLSVRP